MTLTIEKLKKANAGARRDSLSARIAMTALTVALIECRGGSTEEVMASARARLAGHPAALEHLDNWSTSTTSSAGRSRVSPGWRRA